MNLQEQVSQQRVKHVIHSYRLEGDEATACAAYLANLFEQFPLPLIELALVETLIDRWLMLSSSRGLEFFIQTHERLKTWEKQPVISTITPSQFKQVTGLDPAPVFNNPELPPPRSTVPH